MHLPDVNFWLALAFEAHQMHLAAAEWFDGAGIDFCAFCRVTQSGFLRLATNPAVFQDEAVTLDVAWQCYDQLASDERVGYAEEPADLELLWRRRTMRSTYANKVWTDAYIAAFAEGSGLTVVTFDQALGRAYPDLHVVIL